MFKTSNPLCDVAIGFVMDLHDGSNNGDVV